MPNVPDSILNEIKTAAPIVRVLEARGYALRQQGGDLVCQCPLPSHDDKTASFHVTENETGGLAHCFGCDWAGNVFQLVQELDSCSFIEAVVKVAKIGGVDFDVATYWPRASSLAAKTAQPSAKPQALPCPLDAAATGSALDEQVLAFAAAELAAPDSAGKAYLDKRGVWSADLAARFRLGFLPAGKLGRILKENRLDKQRVAGRKLRGALVEQGWWSAKTGHATMDGRVLVPVFGESGDLVQCYGRAVSRLSHGSPAHRHLARPVAGVWNARGLVNADGAAILCEAALDALSFVVAGCDHVSFALGANNCGRDHVTALRAGQAKDVFLAFDNDAAGEKAAGLVAEQVIAAGMTAYRVGFGPGFDANAVLQQNGPDALQEAVRCAQWLGGAPQVAVASLPAAALDDAAELPDPAAISSENPDEINDLFSLAAESLPEAAAPQAPAGVQVEQRDNDLLVHVGAGARSYRVRGLAKNNGNDTLRMSLRALLPVSAGGAQHDDQLDLYNGRQRLAFAKAAAMALRRSVDVINADLGHVLQACEQWQLDRLRERARAASGVAAGARPVDPAATMSKQDRRAAEELLRDPQLLTRVVDDLTACGLVGETVNKLGCYLAATSRLLERPLAVLVQSSSAAGKTTLMDAVLALMPEEARKRASAISEMALYYDNEGLSHKILAIAEEEGAQSASYSLKLLQSDGSLTFARPVKNPDTGELVTKTHQVDGPVQLMLTTTKTLLDDELANRCLVLTVSEDADQTGTIQHRQRGAQSWDGMEQRVAKADLATLHHNAQRLLRPLPVINPFAEQLRFTTARVRARRDHQKYLDLIAAVTLLHQYQREHETRTIAGKEIEAVLVAPQDIAIANELAHVLLGQSLDELSAPARSLLPAIDAFVTKEAKRNEVRREGISFLRRDLLATTGRSQAALKRQLAELVDQEWLVFTQASSTSPMRYRVHFASDAVEREKVCLGLASLGDIAPFWDYDAMRLALGPLWPTCGSPDARMRLTCGSVAETTANPIKILENSVFVQNEAQTPHTGEKAARIVSKGQTPEDRSKNGHNGHNGAAG